MTGAISGLELAALPAGPAPVSLARQLLDEAVRHGPRALLRRSGLAAQLMKALAECLLGAELRVHLQRPVLHDTIKLGNYRNGSTPKTIATDVGKIELAVPRVRFSTFVPQLVARYQRRIPGFDHSIVLLYARGVPLHVLQSRLLGLYGVAVWDQLGGALTAALLEHVRRWQARRIDAGCALLYCDVLAAPAPLLFALALHADGAREVLGLWSGDGQARRWNEAMGELKARGLVAPAAIAGAALGGLEEAAATCYPDARFERLAA